MKPEDLKYGTIYKEDGPRWFIRVEGGSLCLISGMLLNDPAWHEVDDKYTTISSTTLYSILCRLDKHLKS